MTAPAFVWMTRNAQNNFNLPSPSSATFLFTVGASKVEAPRDDNYRTVSPRAVRLTLLL